MAAELASRRRSSGRVEGVTPQVRTLPRNFCGTMTSSILSYSSLRQSWETFASEIGTRSSAP